MTDRAAKTSLAVLAALACVTILTGTAFVAVTYLEWNWLSTLLGCIVVVLVVLCVHVALDAIERWMGREEDDVGHSGEHP